MGSFRFLSDMRRWLVLGLTGWVGLGLSGCSSNNDYAVAISYAVNALPPTADECAFYGIASVRLTIPDGAQKRTLESPCGSRTIFLSDQYEYGGFISTEYFDYGTVYRYELDLIGTHGEQLIQGKGTFRADYGNEVPVELPTLDYFAPRVEGGEIATVTGSFSVGNGGDLAQACAALGINRVEVWVYSALDTYDEFPDRALFASCDAGTLDSGTPLLNAGDYWISYVALNYESEANYTVVDQIDPISVQVFEPGSVQLPPAQFAGP